MSTTKICSFNDFLALFPESPRKKILGGWNVICPAHQDKNPSLSVALKANRILVNCQAGCKTEAVLKLKGLILADLFLDSNHRPEDNKQKTLVATFSYECEKGKEAYQIRRFDLGNGSKTFEAWHKKDGKYVPGMGEHKPIPYHLPEIPEWKATTKRIYLPEGELKADCIISKGGAASTSPFGAGRNKWRLEFSEALRGADMVILPDNDKPGHDFAQEKGSSLYGKAASVKVLELPGLSEKGDIIDWFNAGGTLFELERLASEAPEWKPPKDRVDSGFRLTKLADLLKEPDEDMDYLWENTLIKGGLSILVAKPKVGKSTLSRNLAYALARSEPSFLGRNITSSGPVVYLALEEKRNEVKKHFERMGATEDLPIFIHTGSAPEQAIEELRKAVIESRAVLAIVDPLQRLVRIHDLNDYSSVSLALEPLMQIARENDCHILLIHHANKGIAREGGDSILGSTAIFGSVDCALIMKRSESYRTIESIQRYGEDLPRTVLAFDVVTGLTISGGSLEDVEVAECGKAIMELLIDHEMTEKEIKEGITDHKGGTVSKSLRLLCHEGKIQRQGLGKKGDPYLYATVTRNAGDAGDKYIEIPTIPTIPINQTLVEVINKDSEANHPLSVGTAGNTKKDGKAIEAVLGMPVEKALELWRSKGAPIINLGAGETSGINYPELDVLLSNPDILDRYLETIRQWLEKQIDKTRSES